MSLFRVQSASEQVASYLREQVMEGRWQGSIPGVNRLAKELEVARKTVDAALKKLELEGLLESSGPGRRRQITHIAQETAALRIGILPLDKGSAAEQSDILMLLDSEGHTGFVSEYAVKDLEGKQARCEQMVSSEKADAWLVWCGSRSLLEWFVKQGTPTFALFGWRRGLPLASIGPDKEHAVSEAIARLVELGHRRIVFLCREGRHLPELGAQEQHFLEALQSHGIATGPYNLPLWKDNPDGFRAILEQLFAVTPPTALIVDTSALYVAALQFLAERGIRIPEQVSLIATDPNTTWQWCRPMAHIDWDYNLVMRRIRRWTDNLSQGRLDTRETHIRATFVAGETIGPARD